MGNKNDDPNSKVVETTDAQKFAEQMGISLFETSAKENINVEEVAHCLSSRADVLVWSSLPNMPGMQGSAAITVCHPNVLSVLLLAAQTSPETKGCFHHQKSNCLFR